MYRRSYLLWPLVIPLPQTPPPTHPPLAVKRQKNVFIRSHRDPTSQDERCMIMLVKSFEKIDHVIRTAVPILVHTPKLLKRKTERLRFLLPCVSSSSVSFFFYLFCHFNLLVSFCRFRRFLLFRCVIFVIVFVFFCFSFVRLKYIYIYIYVTLLLLYLGMIMLLRLSSLSLVLSQAGFSPQVHLIAAWDPFGIVGLVGDRLYCRRIGGHVPFSYEEHPQSIGNLLSIKVRGEEPARWAAAAQALPSNTTLPDNISTGFCH